MLPLGGMSATWACCGRPMRPLGTSNMHNQMCRCCVRTGAPNGDQLQCSLWPWWTDRGQRTLAYDLRLRQLPCRWSRSTAPSKS